MKYKCELIQDLMPLCIDSAAADESKNAVVEHMAECRNCEKYYQTLLEELPVESQDIEFRDGYAQLAKKVRKRSRIVRTLVAVSFLLMTGLLFNYANGYRLTADSAAVLSGRLNDSSNLSGTYDWGDWQFYIFNSANTYDTVIVQKHWNGWKAINNNYVVWPKYRIDQGTIINAGALYFWTDTHEKYGIQLFPVIVEDSNVASLEVKVFGETKTVDVVKDELLVLAFQNQDASLENEASGNAYDAKGNLLYTLKDSFEQGRWIWEKAEK